MGENLATSLGVKRGQDVLLFDPDKLTIVQDDPRHFLYNERPETVPEATVLDVMHRGVHTPIKVRRAGKHADGTERIEVVVGTQRVRVARIANERLRARGETVLVQVPAQVVRGDEASLMGLMISENEHRRGSSPMSKARLAQRFMDRGQSEQDTCTTFNITSVTLTNWQCLLECCDEVQKAVDAGTIPACAAKELHAIDHDAQRKALAEMIESGATKGYAAIEAAENAAAGKPARSAQSGARIRSRRFLERARDELHELRSNPECAMLYHGFRFILGEDVALRQLPEDAREALRGLMPRSRKGGSK